MVLAFGSSSLAGAARGHGLHDGDPQKDGDPTFINLRADGEVAPKAAAYCEP